MQLNTLIWRQSDYLKITRFVMIFILTSFLFASCSSSKTCCSDGDSFTGTITVVGNEPFTNLALQVSGGETYLLECEKELAESLAKEQGKTYKIKFNETKKHSRGTMLIVIDAIPISEEK